MDSVRMLQCHKIYEIFLTYHVNFQIPAAWLASKFGFKRVYGLSMLLAGVLTLLFPIAAR